MYSAFHNALDSWPTDRPRSHVDARATKTPQLYDKVTFGEDDHPPAASSVFKVTGANYPVGKVFVPPFFIPPGSTARLNTSHEQTNTSQDAFQEDDPRPEQQRPSNRDNNIDPAIRNSRAVAPKQRAPSSYISRSSLSIRQDSEHQSRSPSSALTSTDLLSQRQVNWSDSARRGFHAMIHAPSYVNRYRLTPAKYQRLLSYLHNPDLDPLNEDGSKDHQTRYQAAHWILRDGKMYRKAERRGVVGTGLRRHLDADEVWDVLTFEHLRTDHLGRDRLRKVLEKRYIGYTLQEIMFVLRECQSCNGRVKISIVAQDDEQRSFEQASAAREGQIDGQSSSVDRLLSNESPESRRETWQSSNFMWF